MAFKFADRLAFEFFQRFLVRHLSPLMWLTSTLLIEARHRQDCQRMSGSVPTPQIRRPRESSSCPVYTQRILKSALSRGVEQQLLARNPAEAFKKRLPKVARRDMKTHTTDESAMLLHAIKHTRIYWPVLIALSTGMRRGEVLALRWRNVDFEGGVVRVVESLEQTKTGIRFKSPKTDRTRAVTLPAFCIEELRRLKRQQAEELLTLGVRQIGETLVCAGADGEPLQPQSLTHQFTRLITRIKDLPRIRLHDLRHSHAT